MIKFLEKHPFHPFLIAAFPVFFLYAGNLTMVSADQMITPLVILGFTTISVLLFCLLVFRNANKAGIVTAILIFIFFFYQSFFSFIQHNTLFTPRHRWVLPGLGISFILFTWYIFKNKNDLNKVTLVLNLTAIFLVLPTTAKIVKRAFNPAFKIEKNTIGGAADSGVKKPDIYYFITDAYGRQDVLKNTFNFDNQPFLDALKNRSFYIADKSTSNYYATAHSVPAALNFNYLQEVIGPEKLKNPANISPKELVVNSRLRTFLKKNNYQYISFSSGVDFTEITNADVYFSPELDFSELDIALLNLTPVPDLFYKYFSRNLNSVYRETILYPFDHLKDAMDIPGAKFVQIHLLSPHAPFIFDENGNATNNNKTYYVYAPLEIQEKYQAKEIDQDYRDFVKGYTAQLKFINKKLLQAVDTILKNSPDPPIIIIQSDHGPRLNSNVLNIEASNHFESFANLSAFYFPQQDTAGLYKEISPVNIFRVVLNKYFGANLSRLPDKSYYNTVGEPYKFTDITEQVKIPRSGPIDKQP